MLGMIIRTPKRGMLVAHWKKQHRELPGRLLSNLMKRMLQDIGLKNLDMKSIDIN